MSEIYFSIVATIIAVVGTWVGYVKAKEKALSEKFMFWGILGLFVYSPFLSFDAAVATVSFEFDNLFIFFLWIFYIGIFFFISVILIGCGFYLSWKQEKEKEREENIEK